MNNVEIVIVKLDTRIMLMNIYYEILYSGRKFLCGSRFILCHSMTFTIENNENLKKTVFLSRISLWIFHFLLLLQRPPAPAPRTPIIPMPSSSRTIERHMLPRTPIPPLQQSSRLTMGQAMARSYVPLPPSRYPVTVGPKTPVAVSQTTGSTFVNQTESTYSFPSSTQGRWKRNYCLLSP